MTWGLSRRRVLGTAGATIAGLPVMAACGSAGSGASGRTPASSASPGTALGSTSYVPVGGCTVFPDAEVVVPQPADGDFKAFSALCTHRGCEVSSSSEGVIPCRCHGSEFALEDGSVVRGPATEGLATRRISVEGDRITLA